MTDASHPPAGDAPAPLSVPGAEAEILEALIEGTAEGLAWMYRLIDRQRAAAKA